MELKNMQKWHKEMIDDMGRMRTTSLFWEVRRERHDPRFVPLFTLKPRNHIVDGITYISLKNIYMGYNHIPRYEYDFAMDVFGSWDHWIKLCKSSIRHEFVIWREELDIKLKAEAIRAMLQASRSDDAKGVAAAKYIADKGYAGAKRGRTSNEDVTRELKQQAIVRSDLDSDMKRLGISVAK